MHRYLSLIHILPNAGELLLAFDSDKEAKNFAGAFVSENKNRLLEETKGKLSPVSYTHLPAVLSDQVGGRKQIFMSHSTSMFNDSFH